MKKHFSKKAIALFLAVLMLVTSAPLVAFADGTTWTRAASTDFSKSFWGEKATSGSDTRRQITGSAYVDGDKTMNWTANSYHDNTMTLDSKGLYIADGYTFMNQYSGLGYTPITGADSFKVDLEYTVQNDKSSVTGRYGFLAIGMSDSAVLGKQNADMKDPSWAFVQDLCGPAYSAGNTLTSTSSSSYNLSHSSTILKRNETYHYVLTYVDGYFHAYITDASGKLVQNLFKGYSKIDTSKISNIAIGDEDGSYYCDDQLYNGITFYTGTKSDATPNKLPADVNKYLFAYFTGNDSEYIRFAVSDDGENFEALNGNRSFINQTTTESYPKKDGVPSTGSGTAATGHARDPYIFRAEDGSYYMLATDMNSVNGSSWSGNSKIMCWHITDLGDIESVVPWNIDLKDVFGKDIDRAWAPQAIWDANRQEYMLYLSIKTADNGSTVLYYVYTPDFKTFTSEPALLMSNTSAQYSSSNKTVDTIDGDITYDSAKNLYYMFYKNDDSDDLYWATSANINGPYAGTSVFNGDGGNTDIDNLEGVQVYRSLADGKYILMADTYGNPIFAVFNGYDLENVYSNAQTENNINHLSPRHGSVTYISSSDYDKLATKYGKETYDSSGVMSGEDVNDCLVARYFTNSDLTYDAADKNGKNTLVNVGATAVTTKDANGKTIAAARFQPTDAVNSSGTKNGGYAYLNNTTDLFNGVDDKSGVTFSWYGYSTKTSIDGQNDFSGHFFDWTSAKEPGTLAWDSATESQLNNAYMYVTAGNSLGVNNNGTNNFMKGYMGSDNLRSWHLYTMTVTDSYIHYFVDGQLIKTTYNKDMKSVNKQGTPLYFSDSQGSTIERLKSGNLFFGISSYGQDLMLDGYISDFRIYNRALSANDITKSLAELDNVYPTTALDKNARSYFDPFETTTIGTNSYTAYNATVADPKAIQGQVGSFAQASGVGFDSHYTYAANDSAANGYTISTYYNPGETINTGTVFSLGKASGSAASRAYFELSEDGTLHYAWEEGIDKSAIDIANVFGSQGLTADKWNHIVIQVQPDADFDVVYTYVNGQLVSKVNTYTAENSLVKGKAIHDYLAQEHTVSYGKSYGGYASPADGFIDNFAIYNGTYAAKDIYLQDNLEIADTLLNETITEFEEKIQQIDDNMNTVVTNMGAAYKIYDEAQRYKAAVEKGEKEVNPEEISELYTQMMTALNSDNMKEYSKPETLNGITTGNSSVIDETYTHNMLSSVNTSSIIRPETKDGYNVGIASGSFVWLYNGAEDTSTAPINAGIYKRDNTGTDAYAETIYPSAGDVALADLWHFDMTQTFSNVDNLNFNGWYYSGGGRLNHTSSYDKSTNRINCPGKVNGAQQWQAGSNYLKYTGTGPTETDHSNVNSYWTSITPTYTSDASVKTNVFGSYWVTSLTIPSIGPIYVVSFVPVKEALFNKDRLNILSHIYDYDPESAQELLDAYDALTSQSYMIDVVNSDNVTTLANTLCEKVKKLESIDVSKIEQKADYTELNQTAAEYESLYNEALQHKDEYTSDAWTAFESAYNAVKNHYTSLDPFGDNQPFVTKQSTVTRLSNNIKTAYAHLTNKADFSPVDTKVADGTAYTINKNQNNLTANGDQKYTYSTYNAFSQSYDAAKAISSTDDAVKKNTPKYLISYVNTNPDLDQYGPYIAYDRVGNVVTSGFVYDSNGNLDLNASGVDRLVYVGTYYDKDAGGKYTEDRLEEGDYIKDDKAGYVNVRNARFIIKSVSDSELSSAQKNIDLSSSNLVATNDNLTEVADYTAYDAATNILKYQDMAAFSAKYRFDIGTVADQSIYGIVTANGTKASTVTYANGVSAGYSITTPSFKTAGASAYVLANDKSYKDFSKEDQTKLDSYTSKILSDLNEANTDDNSSIRSTYTVTLNVKFDDGTSTVTNSQILKYGNTYSVNLNTLSSVPSGYKCYRWEVVSGSTKQTNIPASQTYNLKINSNTEITAYCSKQAVDENYVKVQIYDKFGSLVQEHNVAKDVQLTLKNGSYVIDSATFDSSNLSSLENTPYFTFKGWKVNNSDIANDTTITVGDYAGSDKILRAQMVFDKAADTITVTMDGVPQYYEYDKYETVNAAEGAYGIAAEINGTFYPVSYSDSYSFLTSGDLNFYSIYKNGEGDYTIGGVPITDNRQIVSLDNRLPFVYSIGKLVAVNGNNLFVMYSGASTKNLGPNVEITEMGTLFTTDASVGSDMSKFIIGASGVTAVPAKNPSSDNQFMAKISTDSSTQVYARPYVKYKCTVDIDGDGSYSPATIQTIAYGNICHD